MARNLSVASLTKIQQKLGTEPVNIVSLEFRPFFKVYFADKTIPSEGIDGRIVELGNLDDVLKLESGSATGTVHIVCDDSNGLLKSIYDIHDIHKQPIVIYQWFTDIPYSEKFIIFEGQVASPIIWDEGTRQFSFDVTSKVEDREVGFSLEESPLTAIDVSLIGKAWPLAFGSPRYIPLMPLGTTPTAILLDPFGFPDEGICAQIKRLQSQPDTTDAAPVGAIIEAGTSNEEAATILAANAEALAQYTNAKIAARAQVAQQIAKLQETYDDQKRWLPRRGVHIVPDAGFPMGPVTVKINEVIYQATVSGSSGDSDPEHKTALMHVTRETPIPLPIPKFSDTTGEADDNTYGAEKLGFQFYNTGSTITIVSDYPIAYPVNCIPSNIEGIYAYRKYGGIRKLTKIPAKYYDQIIATTPSQLPNPLYESSDYFSQLWQTFGNNPNDDFDLPFFEFKNKISPEGLQFKNSSYDTLSDAWLRPTFIVMKKQMSVTSFLNEHRQVEIQDWINHLREHESDPRPSYLQNTEEWEDELFANITSSVGPNIVDIIRWIIETFTTMICDSVSFPIVREQVANYPANFCLFERKNVMQLLTEIATQSRCAIWLKGRIFYLKYLSIEPDYTETITDADIEYQTLKIESTDTEQIVTKYKASWKLNYLDTSKGNKVIIRSNIAKYGIQELDVDYYIYNVHYSVKKSATFWTVRKSNTWKRIKFKTFLHKLNIEAMDCVFINLNHPYIANDGVKGIVESAVYDSSNNTIEMSVWIPVRLGDMNPYPFAWPAGLSVEDFYPTESDLKSGGGTVGLIPYHPVDIPSQGSTATTTYNYVEEGANGFLSHAASGDTRLISPGVDTIGTRIMSDLGDEFAQSNYTNPAEAPIPGSVPIYNYALADRKMDNRTKAATPVTVEAAGDAFPGVIISGSGTVYQAEIFKHGLSGPKEIVSVKQLELSDQEEIPTATWVLVVKVLDKNKKPLYYIQAPVWIN